MGQNSSAAKASVVPFPRGYETHDESARGDRQQPNNLENCFKVLASVQEQIRFADTKAAFVLGINTVMFGLLANNITALKKAFSAATVSPPAWLGLVALVVFCLCGALAVGMLIFAVMGRFGVAAPNGRVFFGHIASGYQKNHQQYVADVRAMTDDDWLGDVATQIVETSQIACTKHSAVRVAAILTLIGLACWIVSIFSTACIPGA